MKSILKMLSGKKSYLVAIIAGVATVLQQLGVIDFETYKTVMEFCVPTYMITLRAGVKKSTGTGK